MNYSNVAQSVEPLPVKQKDLCSNQSVGAKICCKCKTEKTLTEFFRNKGKKDGFASECKSCSKQYGKWFVCSDCRTSFWVGHRNVSKRKTFLCSGCAEILGRKKLIARNKANASYRTTSQKGYQYVFCHERKKYIFEHRIAMEKKLGRHLASTEIIHHIDDDKTNNHIDNLWLTDNSGHRRAHLSLLDVAWDAVRSGLIKFNADTGRYELT